MEPDGLCLVGLLLSGRRREAPATSPPSYLWGLSFPSLSRPPRWRTMEGPPRCPMSACVSPLCGLSRPWHGRRTHTRAYITGLFIPSVIAPEPSPRPAPYRPVVSAPSRGTGDTGILPYTRGNGTPDSRIRAKVDNYFVILFWMCREMDDLSTEEEKLWP